jgi:hypothetical protein
MFICHELSAEQNMHVAELRLIAEDVICPAGSSITFGEANVIPFNIELKSNGLYCLRAKKIKAFPAHSGTLDLLKAMMNEMAKVGISEFDPMYLQHLSPGFFAHCRQSEKL